MLTEDGLQIVLAHIERLAGTQARTEESRDAANRELSALRREVVRLTQSNADCRKASTRLNTDLKRAEQCWEMWQKHVGELEHLLRTKGVRKLPQRPPMMEMEVPF